MHTGVSQSAVAAFAPTQHAAVAPHLRPEPLTYLLTKLGTYAAPEPAPPSSAPPLPHPTLPAHENTPSARVWPDNMNMTIHTLRAGRENTGGRESKRVGGRGGDSKGSQALRV